MKFTFTTKKVDLSDSVKDYAEKKISKLDRYFKAEADAYVTFSVEKNNRCVVEVTIRGGNTLFRAQEENRDGNMRAAIDAAQDYYDGLPAEIAANVSNASALESAATELQSLRQAAADELLAGMRLEEDVVRNMRFYYPSNWVFLSNGSWLADQTCFIRPYLGQDDSSTWLRLIYNYTGDDWVFFTKLTLLADGETYHKSFNYFDIVRDNSGGVVWEYIDDDGTGDEEMLWAIANSSEAMIRFEGDDYVSDYTVRDSDKEIIRQALEAYEALQ